MEWIKTNWRISAGIAGTIVLIIVICVFALNIEKCSFNSGIKKDDKAINAEVNTAVNINANLANLNVKIIEAQANANQANVDLQRIENEVNKAKEIGNQAAVNANNVANANYRGTNADDANAARCAAFPQSDECIH